MPNPHVCATPGRSGHGHIILEVVHLESPPVGVRITFADPEEALRLADALAWLLPQVAFK